MAVSLENRLTTALDLVLKELSRDQQCPGEFVGNADSQAHPRPLDSESAF